MKGKNAWFGSQVWELIYPLLMYYAVTVFVMLFARSILGTSEEQYMLCQCIVDLVAIPVIYLGFYRPDLKIWSAAYAGSFESHGVRDVLFTLAIALTLGTGINNLICMSPLIEASAGFAEANRNFYSATLMIELIGSGLLTPIAEELIWRGVFYGRVRRMLGLRLAIVVSALGFAFVHFNLVQGLYALLLGLAFALILEKGGRLYLTMLAHMACNTLAVLRTELGLLAFTSDGSAGAWILSLLLTSIGLVLLWVYVKPKTLFS